MLRQYPQATHADDEHDPATVARAAPSARCRAHRYVTMKGTLTGTYDSSAVRISAFAVGPLLFGSDVRSQGRDCCADESPAAAFLRGGRPTSSGGWAALGRTRHGGLASVRGEPREPTVMRNPTRRRPTPRRSARPARTSLGRPGTSGPPNDCRSGRTRDYEGASSCRRTPRAVTRPSAWSAIDGLRDTRASHVRERKRKLVAAATSPVSSDS